MASQFNAIFIMLIPFGALLIGLGIFVFFRMRGPSNQTLSASGIVIDQEECDSDGVTYSPIVKFSAHDGTTITFTDSMASYPALYKIGEEVRVLYDPENFQQARIASSLRRNLSAIILCLLGIVMLTIGLVFMQR